MDRKERKLLAAGVAVSGCVTGIYAAAIRMIFDIACKPTVQINKRGERKPLEGLAKEGQDWLHENGKDVRIMESEDGLKLRAHYIPCENAKRTVIEFHGWHGGWDLDFSASSPFLHRMGCNLLIVEERAQGHSEGTYISMGIRERRDVSTWVRWYQDNIDPETPIYLAGISMGAATVLMASADDFPPQVKGIIADCGYTSPYEILKVVGKKWFHLPEHPFCDSLNRYFKQKFGEDLTHHTALDAVKQTTLPILFVHGTDDTFVPYTMSVEMYEACGSGKELFLVEGAEHGMSFLVDTEGYNRKVEEFFAL